MPFTEYAAKIIYSSNSIQELYTDSQGKIIDLHLDVSTFHVQVDTLAGTFATLLCFIDTMFFKCNILTIDIPFAHP